jgi:hypothetical protein
MGVISAQRLALVQGLVKTLPLKSLRLLEGSLSLTNDPAFVEVRQLLTAELDSHYVKSEVFKPFLPLFTPRNDEIDVVIFPNWILNGLWRNLKEREIQLCNEARVILRGLKADDPTPVVFFRLVSAAAEIARHEPLLILPKGADEADQDLVSEFAHYLDLHRLLRGALVRLPDWLARIDTEKATSIKLMFKDATKLSEASGHRLMEVLFAHLEDPVTILKFVVTVSDRGSDRYLSETEMADFGERLLEEAEAKAKTIETLLKRRLKETHQLSEASELITGCLSLMLGIEQTVELTRDGPWNKRIAAIHKTIASHVEDRLREIEKLVTAALPTKSERVHGRVAREMPRLEGASEEVFSHAQNTLAFLTHLKPSANQGGYGSLMTKVLQAVEQIMDRYFDNALSVATAPDPFNADQLMQVFERVTDLMEVVFGPEKAGIARRRVAATNLFDPSKSVA